MERSNINKIEEKDVDTEKESQNSIKTITAAQLEDPLAFDMSKVLVFKMP